MKKDGKYRFSLQFKDSTEEARRAGDLLERMGNRKSGLVVAAVGEYLAYHPGLDGAVPPARIPTPPEGRRESLEQMVRRLVDENMEAHRHDEPSQPPRKPTQGKPMAEPQGMDEQEQTAPADRTQADGIGQMLDNLGMFGQA